MEQGTKTALAWGGGIVAVILVALLVAWLLWSSPAKADDSAQGKTADSDKRTEGGSSGPDLDGLLDKVVDKAKEAFKRAPNADEPPPDLPPPEFDPLNPETTPKMGKAYVVKDGDNMDKILRAAGFTTAAGYGHLWPVKQAMLSDPENAWMPQTGTGTGRTLQLTHRYEKVPGKDYGYKTKYHYDAGYGDYGFPCVRLPKPGEVQGG